MSFSASFLSHVLSLSIKVSFFFFFLSFSCSDLTNGETRSVPTSSNEAAPSLPVPSSIRYQSV